MQSFIEPILIVIGLLAYTPIVLGISRNKIRSSFCTWILWTLLNISVLASLISQGAPYLIAIVYTIGTFIIALMVLIKKQFSWATSDTVIAVLVLICTAVLILGNAYWATIVGSMASFIAGIPEIMNVIKNPKNGSKITALLFIAVNMLVIMITSDRSFINIIFPLTWCFYWICILALSFNKKSRLG